MNNYPIRIIIESVLEFKLLRLAKTKKLIPAKIFVIAPCNNVLKKSTTTYVSSKILHIILNNSFVYCTQVSNMYMKIKTYKFILCNNFCVKSKYHQMGIRETTVS